MFVQEQFIDVVVQMSSKKIGVKLGKVDKSDRYLQVFSYTEILGVLLLNVY